MVSSRGACCNGETVLSFPAIHTAAAEESNLFVSSTLDSLLVCAHESNSRRSAQTIPQMRQSFPLSNFFFLFFMPRFRAGKLLNSPVDKMGKTDVHALSSVSSGRPLPRNAKPRRKGDVCILPLRALLKLAAKLQRHFQRILGHCYAGHPTAPLDSTHGVSILAAEWHLPSSPNENGTYQEQRAQTLCGKRYARPGLPSPRFKGISGGRIRL